MMSVPRWAAGMLILSTLGCSNEAPRPTATGTSRPGASATVSTGTTATSTAKAATTGEVPDLSAKVAQFAPAVLTADVSGLPASERAALDKLIEASRLLDPVFNRQVVRDYDTRREALANDASEAGKNKLAYFDIMRGPWDRQDDFAPFATDGPRPPGAGFYPPDMTDDDLEAYLKKNPNQRDALLGLFTIVDRKDDGTLVAVKYSEAYGAWLKPAAAALREAAALTENASLKTFLEARAAAFLSDDYYASDKAWMDLDSTVEITIGPYETYEDKLKAAKASFESFVTVADPKASADLAKYKALLPEMEQNLPVDDAVKTKRGSESPIRVVDLVFTAGDARKSVQTIAFNLPNDERVRKEKGAKKVLLRNLIQKKFDLILKPIAQQIINEDQLQFLSSDAFFNQVLFHELSHSLGPARVGNVDDGPEVRQALEATYAPLEECKADVMGAYNILFMIEKEAFPKEFRKQLLASYFAGLFRSVRFGAVSAHGKGAAIQINRFLAAGGASFDDAAGRFTLDFDKLEAAIAALVKDLVMVQHRGDKSEAQAMLDKYGVVSPPMKKALDKLDGVPVDLKPIYPLAGEK
ncbi:MAG: hypothetical protein AAF715_14955 [Myxococcota bacterium]